MAIEKRLQVKYNQVISKYQGHFSKPVYKFIRQVVYGMLKTQHVHLSKIACSLNERISLKKTWERLSRNMGRAGLAEEVMASHIQENSREFKRKKYWVVDLTDISKVYANAMEGLGGIWDGSKGKAGKGYWVVNVAGISPRDESISLMYRELFSLDQKPWSKTSFISPVNCLAWIMSWKKTFRKIKKYCQPSRNFVQIWTDKGLLLSTGAVTAVG